MKPKDWFKLALQLLGLIFLYLGLSRFPGALGQFIGSFPQTLGMGIRQRMNFGMFFDSILIVGWPLLVSFWLLKGAPLLMRIAYPEETAVQPGPSNPPAH
jgi:hypothetical protein